MDFWFWVWLLAAIGFAVIEASTLTFFVLPFSLGALAALVLNLLDVSIPLQWVAFFALSLPAMFLLRPFARRVSGNVKQTSAIDRMVGAHGVVTQRIDPDLATGQVRVKGEIWLAIPEDGVSILGEGTDIRVIRIEGTRAVVVPEVGTPALDKE